ncbi:hypothetical protein PoB_002230300 [Plakobranchus ocellatus]|uniref:Uncharacterized protein n=1 Tax=Plakobranchus ocellatus TaxID=259542 RepID=A0AAV3ZMW1_9GAST|nr:hypothetical protein PoB_002230300 [Plakobranchus ocellatus]
MDLRLSGPLSGHGTGSRTQTRDRKASDHARSVVESNQRGLTKSHGEIITRCVTNAQSLLKFGRLVVMSTSVHLMDVLLSLGLRITLGGRVGGTVASESALRSAGTLLSQVLASPSALQPDGGP